MNKIILSITFITLFASTKIIAQSFVYEQPTELMHQVLKDQNSRIDAMIAQQDLIYTTAGNISMQVLEEYRDATIKAVQPILKKNDEIADIINDGDAKEYLRQAPTALRKLGQDLTREMTTGEVGRFIRNTKTFQEWQTKQLENRNIDPTSRQKILNSRYDPSNPNGLYHIIKRSVVSGNLYLPEIPLGYDAQNEWQKYANQSYNTSASNERKTSNWEDKQQTNRTSNYSRKNNENNYRKISLVSNAIIYQTPDTKGFYNIYNGGEVKLIGSYSNKITKIFYNNRIYYVESKYITNANQ
ncbi:hypothetical protein FACS1894179_10090 [Bacteroidia bacterium]|nr:hypothetical protein FACS1894179_10090 [Bacteroidia bacterium]